MSMITVNGKTIKCPEGSSISVIDGVVYIDGKKSEIETPDSKKIIISGNLNLNCLEVHGDVEIHGDVNGHIKARGSVNCKNVKSGISAGGSVNCNDVGGSVSAGGSVNCDLIEGNCIAGGSIRK